MSDVATVGEAMPAWAELRPLTVAIAIARPSLAQRIGTAVALHPLIRLAAGDAPEDADLVIANDDPGPDRVTLALTQNPAVLPRWRAEIRGVLPDTVRIDRLHAAIDALAAGLAVLPPELMQALQRTAPSAVSVGVSELTARERQVLHLLAGGEPNKIIARRLGISLATVKFHVAAVLSKLGARSRSDAIAIAARRGLVML